MLLRKIAWLLCSLTAFIGGDYIARAQYSRMHNIGVNQGLTQGYVSGIAQDSYGFLWIATFGGLNRWDGQNVLTFRHSSFDPNSLSSNTIKHLICDSKDQLWLTFENGDVDLYSRRIGRFFHISELLPIKGQKCIGIIEGEGNTYMALTLQQVIFFSLEIPASTNNALPNPSVQVLGVQSHPYKQCTHVYRINQEQIMVANDSTLFVCGNRLETLLQHPLKVKLGQGQSIFPFQNNHERNTLIVTVEGTAWVCNTSGNHVTLETSENISLPKPPGLPTISIFCDGHGRWWAGTGGDGLFYMATNNYIFTPTNHPDPDFRSIYGCELLNRETLVYFSRETFLRYDLTTDQFDTSPAFPFYKVKGYEIRLDRTGQVWIVADKGVEVHDKDNRFLQSVFSFTANEPCAYALRILGNHALFITRSALYCYDTDTRLLKEKLPFPTNLFIKEKTQFHQILDWKGGYLLATSEGVFTYDRAVQQWSPLTIRGVNFREEVFVLAHDRKDSESIWIGTGGNGLLHFTPGTQALQSFTTKDGVSGDIIYGLLYSNDGALWMSTNSGITRMKTEEKSFQAFTTNAEQYSSECNRYSYFTPDGEHLYFGGVDGVVHLRASAFRPSLSPIKLCIESIETVPEAKRYFSKSSADANDVLRIETNEKNSFFHITFLAPQLDPFVSTYYRYRITGMQEDWSEPTAQGELIFPNLSAGNYTLHLAVSNGNGQWYEYPQVIELSIAPMWYRTIWFYIVLTALLSIAVYLFYRMRIAQIKEKQAIKDGLARDLHDEIGSSLSSIAIYTEVALHQKTDTEKVESVLLRILRTSTQTQEMMSGIIRTLKQPDATLTSFGLQLQSIASHLLEGTGVQLEFNIPIQSKEIIHAQQFKHLTMMTKEAINNSLKYSQATKIRLELHEDTHTLSLRIEDNGRGFNPEEVTRGNGLNNMKERARLMNATFSLVSRPNEGTRIDITWKK